ncbi:hypothetical protein K3X41_07890 [Aliiroseovarius crassostreae]|uniref:Flp family type IVb pilin n=1 Tax=Aliiroseovarius crassostreae TaxID=154981 RepID=A0A9Q9HBA2_9RHOB|nr:hypothetical protein [Aliiroseovarius crassostreae]UWP94190.1 hypothetical protein K3X48_07920 [Aliiroseovarius crassostreae]UWP97314.1 hypothetical protein K3X53_07745 [Aliiroseovarius crassostreae]UWQ06775.1 hypothetical protein K3X25_08030 [Aliiroseovarius crassostreae]UWQ09877.1 hypothetical protein K3X41_07890 [Aliiroseovarius crassostreae]
MSKLIEKLVLRFRKDEDGIALTEYLILLGLLASAVIAAVLLFGDELGANWETWANWMRDETDLHAPAIGSGG